MGTRSLTRVNTSTGAQIVCMYCQFDGYPSGHGADLFAFLDGITIINGYSTQKAGEAANGAGCLAAQMIAKFKTGIGGTYLYPVESTDCGQDYEYIVTVTNVRDETPVGGIEVKVIGYKGEEFSGTVAEFGEFCKKEPNDD